jgi:hypothetical protein
MTANLDFLAHVLYLREQEQRKLKIKIDWRRKNEKLEKFIDSSYSDGSFND